MNRRLHHPLHQPFGDLIAPPTAPALHPAWRHQRRALLLGGVACAAALAGLRPAAAQAVAPLVEVWKSPSCGCCKDWMAHLQQHGFEVRAHDTGNTDVRARLGMPLSLGSCHTASVGGYAIEGHVPAREIRRLLKDRPTAVGLSVPAMPVGSPGMDGPEYGGRKDRFNVLLVARDGSHRVYQAY